MEDGGMTGWWWIYLCKIMCYKWIGVSGSALAIGWQARPGLMASDAGGWQAKQAVGK